jgi:acetylornithine deacetylase/succinyl-diaminopimelate desuccinylase-like protein
MNSLYGKKIKHSLNRLLFSKVITFFKAFRTIKDVIAIPGIFLAACDARWLQEFSDHIFRFYPFVMEKEDLPGIHGREEKLRWQSYEDGINFYLDFFRHMDEQELPPGHTEL